MYYSINFFSKDIQMGKEELSLNNFIPTKRTAFEMISLYEFLAVAGILILSILLKNSFLAVLFTMLILKQIPEKILKLFVFEGKAVNRRPLAAQDCNMINKGGPAWKRSGFPSGHTTVAFFLWAYFLFEFIKRRNVTGTKEKSIPPVIVITSLFAILVPYARVGIECHTLEQVMAGSVLGISWAALFFYGIDPALERASNQYSQDRKRIFDALFQPKDILSPK
jgi:membrane-associated phospholipid phosphatase